ncbi:MAG TPA: pyrroline-5-carboxylate reductase dimerization domain-containing protein [Solirubrobacteraceae bacterium]|jgi:pyrroline-5-carboxylate reductase|nr:pyrroline-5-carboxylate reductase dimerization domain-containing protein [Solirubrobacteraceae bacterium]
MTIGLIGAGNMARALALGWREPVLVCDSGSGRAAALAADIAGARALPSAEQVAAQADTLVLCHKPAQLGAVARAAAPQARRVISVLAGTPLERLQSAYPDAQVAWVMPNTAVEVRAGLSCLCEGPDNELARELFARLGRVVEVPERLMGVATALAGVAPAYTALLVEAQTDAAVRHGMPAALAAQIVAPSLEGSCALIGARAGDTLGVRRAVTSPGGVTAKGLKALEEHGLRTAFHAAMDAVLGTAA